VHMYVGIRCHNLYIFCSVNLCIFCSVNLCIFCSVNLCIFFSVNLCIFCSVNLCIFCSCGVKASTTRCHCLFVRNDVAFDCASVQFSNLSLRTCIYQWMYLCIFPSLLAFTETLNIHTNTHDYHDRTDTYFIQLFAQPRPLVFFSWDGSLLSETQGFELKSTSISDIASSKECVDGGCLSVPKDGFVQMATHNFGQYTGITIAFWFKPTTASGSDARVIEFSRGVDVDTVMIARKGTTEDMQLSVRLSTQGLVSTCTSTGTWQSNLWKHVAWTLTPFVSNSSALWDVYVDGICTIASYPGLYPINADFTSNYFGKSNVASVGGFVGYIDSFFLYQSVVSSDQILAISKVRFLSRT
jgi:hypothetical protein